MKSCSFSTIILFSLSRADLLRSSRSATQDALAFCRCIISCHCFVIEFPASSITHDHFADLLAAECDHWHSAAGIDCAAREVKVIEEVALLGIFEALVFL